MSNAKTNTTINTIETLEDVMQFHKTWLEIATGRTFDKVRDNASKYEEDGNAFSYMLELGSGNASTRFQTWITARKNVRCDLYVGNAYITTDTIDITLLQDYRKGNDKGQGNTYRNVPMHVIKAFFESNELVKRDTKSKQSAKAV